MEKKYEMLPKELLDKMLANGRLHRDFGTGDFVPVVKLFTPDGAGTWLLTELDPDNPDIAFGLADLGFGSPEMGSVSISELKSVHGKLGLAIERDITFKGEKTLTEYAKEAREKGRIDA